MFDEIETMLEEEEDTFFCVFIDEIETLASRRDRSLSGNEPFDAIRAVNAVLTGLDKLRRHSNVVVISTSNLVTALVSIPSGDAPHVHSVGYRLPRPRGHQTIHAASV